MFLFLNKKGWEEIIHLFFLFYGFFISTSAIIAIAMMTATSSAAIAGRKYRSAADGAGVGIGVAVASAWSTVKVVAAVEPQ